MLSDVAVPYLCINWCTHVMLVATQPGYSDDGHSTVTLRGAAPTRSAAPRESFWKLNVAKRLKDEHVSTLQQLQVSPFVPICVHWSIGPTATAVSIDLAGLEYATFHRYNPQAVHTQYAMHTMICTP